MSYYIEYYKEKDTDPMVFLQRFRCTTEPIGGGTEPDEEGELVSWEAAVAAIEIAKKQLIDKACEYFTHMKDCDFYEDKEAQKRAVDDFIDRFRKAMQ